MTTADSFRERRIRAASARQLAEVRKRQSEAAARAWTRAVLTLIGLILLGLTVIAPIIPRLFPN